MLLYVIHQTIDAHNILFAISNILISLGAWFHFNGFSRVLVADNVRLRERSLIAVFLITSASGVCLIIGNTVYISRLIANLFHIFFIATAIKYIYGKRHAINIGQAATLYCSLAIPIILYSFSSIGCIGTILKYDPLKSLANPLMLLGVYEWLIIVFLLAMTENILLIALLAKEKDERLSISEDRRTQLAWANRELEKFHSQILKTLSEILELKVEEAAPHVRRVAQLTHETMLKLGYNPDYAIFVAQASMLHDIGKVGIPDSILKKNGLLTPEERKTMQEHSLFGEQLLSESDIPFFQLASRIAAEHHEQFSGGGYPKQKKANDISIEARVVSVADAYDALTNRRSYKAAWTHQQAKDYILQYSGIYFDPKIVDAFFNIKSIQIK